jgi:hypothetical protein
MSGGRASEIGPRCRPVPRRRNLIFDDGAGVIYFHFADVFVHRMKARVMPVRQSSLPAEMRKLDGLVQGGDTIVEDTGDAIALRALDQVVARAQALSRTLLAGKTGASVDDFLAERMRDA